MNTYLYNLTGNTLRQHWLAFSLPIVFSLLLSSCFVPKSQIDESYEECDLTTKTWELKRDESLTGIQIAANNCNSPECIIGFLFSGGIIVGGSYIVSGSIVAIGNFIHWMERNTFCDEEAPDADYIQTVNSTKGQVIHTKEELLQVLDPTADQPES